ncbi:unnamed protein product [Effrenium voratum]|nr:unnamed protein product [Effrenium voratum]
MCDYQCLRYTNAVVLTTQSPVLSNFEPVNGGQDQACRGSSVADNSNAYFTVASASSLTNCGEQCMALEGCQGIEFHPSGRCELWTRPGGIEATKPLDQYQCYRYLSAAFPTGFSPKDGAVDRACRGGSASDNNPGHYTAVHGISAAECFSSCADKADCVGVEISLGRCELWTRAEGIQATAAITGFQCYTYARPVP